MVLCHVSSSNSQSNNHRHILMTRTDHCNSKLSENIQYEKNSHSFFLEHDKFIRNLTKKVENFCYVSGVFLVYSGHWKKLQLIQTSCTVSCNISYFHICLYYSFIFCFYFLLLFLTLLTIRRILK